MTRNTWNTTWMEVALVMAQRSACGRAQVGAVVVQDRRVVATGYNGPASGYPTPQTDDCRSWCERAKARPDPSTGYGYACPSIHAEANALLHASRSDVLGSTLYVTHAPCAECAKLISNSGVAHVVMAEKPPAHRPNPMPYLEQCGIRVTVLAKEAGQWVPSS